MPHEFAYGRRGGPEAAGSEDVPRLEKRVVPSNVQGTDIMKSTSEGTWWKAGSAEKHTGAIS